MVKDEHRTKEFWDLIWSRPYSNYIDHHKIIWREVKKRVVGKILDLGCGSASCWDSSPLDYTGVDFSHEALTQAKRNMPRGKYVHSSLEKIPLNSKYSTVVLCGVINYFPDLSNIRREATRLCGNQIIVTVNMLEDFPGRIWNRQTLEEEFSQWGKITECILFEKIAWLIRIAV